MRLQGYNTDAFPNGFVACKYRKLVKKYPDLMSGYDELIFTLVNDYRGKFYQ